MVGNSVLHRKLSSVEPIAGFTPKAIGAHEEGNIVCAGFYHSGEEIFHRLAPQLWSIYCGCGTPLFRPESVSDFLAVIHSDGTADVFAGNIPKRLSIRAKRKIEANAQVPASDFADITEQRFIDIDIVPTDALAYCFRVDWRYGLYFDFGPTVKRPREDQDNLWRQLGSAHRFLIFFDEYTAHEHAPTTGLLDDGWFPFIQLLGGDYRLLADYYADPDARRFVDGFIKKFDTPRITALTEGWWSNPLFASKKEIILAGIDAYALGTQRGSIACLKVLYSEIEGLIRIACCQDRGISRATFADLVEFVTEKGNQRFDGGSLAFPDAFYRYLTDQVFANFDILEGEVPLSRHSSSHGVADVATYSRAKALQAILTLDQLFFYLPTRNEKLASAGGPVGPAGSSHDRKVVDDRAPANS